MVNEEISHVQEWLMLNQLTLNVKQCNFILFKAHKKQLKTNLSINLNSQEIRKVDKTKFLGTIIDQHLTFFSYILLLFSVLQIFIKVVKVVYKSVNYN